jgi:hypothetical protein
VQTARFGHNVAADCLELAAWLLLFAAGLIGLSRAEWIPVAHTIYAKESEREQQIREISGALAAGRELPVVFDSQPSEILSGRYALEEIKKRAERWREQRVAAEKRILVRYAWMKWTFLFGIGCLLAARGLPPALDIGCRLLA